MRPGYLKLTTGSHMIYFRENGDRLEIMRILHNKQDVERPSRRSNAAYAASFGFGSVSQWVAQATMSARRFSSRLPRR